LTPGTQYSYRGYAQNANGIGYSSVGTFYALVNEPTVQATGATIVNVQRSYFTLNWTRGNGDNCIVVVRAGAAVNAAPVDGVTYTTGANWNSGTQIGVGNYVAYLGAGNTVVLSGLTVGTTYHVAVYEVNGTGGPDHRPGHRKFDSRRAQHLLFRHYHLHFAYRYEHLVDGT
jgi:hypothetical protein